MKSAPHVAALRCWDQLHDVCKYAWALPRHDAVFEGVRHRHWRQTGSYAPPLALNGVLAEQYFWFRHSFMLGRKESGTLQGAVQQLLRDSKLEVCPQSQLPRPWADAPCVDAAVLASGHW